MSKFMGSRKSLSARRVVPIYTDNEPPLLHAVWSNFARNTRSKSCRLHFKLHFTRDGTNLNRRLKLMGLDCFPDVRGE